MLSGIWPAAVATLPSRLVVSSGAWLVAVAPLLPLRPAVLSGLWPAAELAPLPLRPTVLSAVWPQLAHPSSGGLSFAERPIAYSR